MDIYSIAILVFLYAMGYWFTYLAFRYDITHGPLSQPWTRKTRLIGLLISLMSWCFILNWIEAIIKYITRTEWWQKEVKW